MAGEVVNHFIGGQPARSALLKNYGVPDPATGKDYAEVAVGLAADINQAVLAARDAMAGPWPELSATERAAALDALADAVGERAGDIAGALALGSGLPVTQARQQAALAAWHFRRAAARLTARGDRGDDPSGYVLERPAGIAGLITPWRTPFTAQARALAPALAAGCAVVLKPDEWAPLPAALLTEVAVAAGLPDGVLNVVHGSLHHRAPGTQARDALISHPSVTRLWFEGDAAAGQQVMLDAAASRTPLRARVAGISPCVVFADADLDRAARAAAYGAFALNGQRATASSAVLAERPVYEELVSRLAAAAGSLVSGAPADPATQVGPLVHADVLDKAVAVVRLGLREGARVVAGGRRPADLPEGNYLAPTVVSEVTPDLEVFTAQLCAPVVRVTPFDTEEEAGQLARALGDLPAAYVWTADEGKARRLALAAGAAATWVNSANARDLPAPPAVGQDEAAFFTAQAAVHTGRGDEADEPPAVL